MLMKPTLSMAQKQLLVMTPKLQQAIKILQMPRLELSQYLNQQMLENPFLEERYDEIEENITDGDIEEKSDTTEDDLNEAEVDLETGLPETDVISDSDLPELDVTDNDFGDVDWQEYFADSLPKNNEWEEPIEEERQDNIPVVQQTLQEYLLWQLRMTKISDSDYEIGESIIGNIDDDGYLTVTTGEISETFGYNISDVERVLKIIQSLEPTGVGARDLKECLIIQLKQMDQEDTIAYKIIENGYLEDLEANHYPQVAKELGVSIDDVHKAVSVISSLEPRPGRRFGSTKAEYIIPDVIVEKIDGKYTVLMNDYGPRLGLSPYYRDLLTTLDTLDEDGRKFIQSKFESALWLLESIERRRKTILKVSEAIFNVQQDFLEKGPQYLKPLTLREVADKVGVHEATVSRVVRNRYVQTPRGIFELKNFFSSGISTEDGGMTSSISVKEMIKNMVENEDPKNPLSDKDIEEELNKKGFKIARRTIAKYRAELNIPPSNKRKKW